VGVAVVVGVVVKVGVVVLVGVDVGAGVIVSDGIRVGRTVGIGVRVTPGTLPPQLANNSAKNKKMDILKCLFTFAALLPVRLDQEWAQTHKPFLYVLSQSSALSEGPIARIHQA
jgi:hypothetical protein